MKFFTQSPGVLGALTFLTGWVLATGCSEDDGTVTRAETPSIAVLSNNSAPFQGDVVTFTIVVSSPTGLQSVSLNDEEIKSYPEPTLEDQFIHEVTIPADANTGPTAFLFSVSDRQTEVVNNEFQIAVTIQNSDVTGNPNLLTDFQTTPDVFVEAFSSVNAGSQAWQQAWTFETAAADPSNSANLVVKANRQGANEWGFQGFGALTFDLFEDIPEDEMIALQSGGRVLQVDLYFQEIDRSDLLVSNDPADFRNPDTQQLVDFSFTLEGTGRPGWDFAKQDTTELTIPVQIDVGNQELWGIGNDFTDGRGLSLYGSITEANTWQTVTFSVGYNTSGDPANRTSRGPKRIGDGNIGDFRDPRVNVGNVNRMAFFINAGFRGKTNDDGWYKTSGNDAGKLETFNDTHNTYYIDNIRIIDTQF
ncbi:MAG: hypothetical protein MJA30_32010 [Cytophagales bacterium]|nr:hypothetical protein [Cytophagales bacterium]